jgi:hypothetical protein
VLPFCTPHHLWAGVRVDSFTRRDTAHETLWMLSKEPAVLDPRRVPSPAPRVRGVERRVQVAEVVVIPRVGVPHVEAEAHGQVDVVGTIPFGPTAKVLPTSLDVVVAVVPVGRESFAVDTKPFWSIVTYM